MSAHFGMCIRRGVLQLIAGAVLVAGLAVAAPVMAASPDEVKSAIKSLYEAYLRRSLTSSELSQLYAENAKDIAEADADRLQETQEATEVLRKQDGKPAAFHLRHEFIQLLAFKKEHPFGAKLVASLDAVAVADEKRDELMTEGDVRALINIMRFANTGADPAVIDKAPLPNDAKIAATVTTELRAAIREGGALPEMMRDASAFWIGLVQNWTSLSAQEKETVRGYITKNMAGRLTELPDSLYSRLMGWSTFDIKMADLNKTIAIGQMYNGLYARIVGLNSLILGNNPWVGRP